jgi:hypothetical protein
MRTIPCECRRAELLHLPVLREGIENLEGNKDGAKYSEALALGATFELCLLVVAGILAAISTIKFFSAESPNLNRVPTQFQIATLNDLNLRIDACNLEIKKLESNVKALSQIPETSKAAAELNRVSGSITEIQNRLSNIEQIVLDNPSKAIGLLLLRKDLDSMKESYTASVLLLTQEVNRVYDQNKWFLGLMITLFLTNAGLVISNFLKGREKESK